MIVRGSLAQNTNGAYYWEINWTNIQTALVHLAGRWVEHWASDIFLVYANISPEGRDRNWRGEKFLIGFRKNGIDQNESVIGRLNNLHESNVYRKLAVIDIIVEDRDIRMLYKEIDA